MQPEHHALTWMSPSITLAPTVCRFQMHSDGPENKHEVQLSYFYPECLRVSNDRGRWQLPLCTSRFHLTVILGESVGGAIRVFFKRLWVQWWRDRTQCDITWIYTHSSHRNGHKRTGSLDANRTTCCARVERLRRVLPGILCICLNIVLYHSLDFSVFWNERWFDGYIENI